MALFIMTILTMTLHVMTSLIMTILVTLKMGDITYNHIFMTLINSSLHVYF
jgi:hypothetical protein